MKTLQRTVIGTLGVLLVIVIAQTLLPRQYVPQEPQVVPEQVCTGEPIVVDYPFEGGYLDPWACKVQCDDGRQRYVLYSNGLATQCETPPGCNDLGEDRGVTCVPPESSREEGVSGEEVGGGEQ